MTKRERVVFTTIISLLFLVILATACSCGARQTPNRSATERHIATIRVATMCSDGSVRASSGVLVSGTRALIALHAIECPDGYVVLTVVDPGDGKPRMADIELVLPQLDTARIIIREDLSKYFTPVAIGPEPKMGEEVCEAASWPRWVYRCGLVQPRDEVGFFRFEFMVEHGNSGGGVYDSEGRLVGLVSQWRACEGNAMCEGVAHPLVGYEWLVPEFDPTE